MPVAQLSAVRGKCLLFTAGTAASLRDRIKIRYIGWRFGLRVCSRLRKCVLGNGILFFLDIKYCICSFMQTVR